MTPAAGICASGAVMRGPSRVSMLSGGAPSDDENVADEHDALRVHPELSRMPGLTLQLSRRMPTDPLSQSRWCESGSVSMRSEGWRLVQNIFLRVIGSAE